MNVETAADVSSMHAHASHNPFVFIVGCARSGTTLLKRLMDAHPAIAIAPGGRGLVRRWLKRRGLTAEGHVTRALAGEGRVCRSMSKEEFRRFVDEVLAEGRPVSYAELVTRMFDRYAAECGRPFVGHKVASSVREMATIHELWPWALFLHIIRDGRDVALSAMAWRKASSLAERYPAWREDPVATAAAWWEWHVRLGREGGGAAGAQRYLEVRYERLVEDPSVVCQEVCAFLGVDFEEAMLRFWEGRTRDDDDLDAKHSWRPVTRGLRDWRTEMDPGDQEAFEALAGGLLDELGYERAFPQPGAGARERATRVRQAFEASVEVLPEGW